MMKRKRSSSIQPTNLFFEPVIQECHILFVFGHHAVKLPRGDLTLLVPDAGRHGLVVKSDVSLEVCQLLSSQLVCLLLEE